MTDNNYQERLAIEHMQPKHCIGCRFYCYSKNSKDQFCTFHSLPEDECNLVILDREGKLNESNTSRTKI